MYVTDASGCTQPCLPTGPQALVAMRGAIQHPGLLRARSQMRKVYYSPTKVTFNLYPKPFCPCLKPQPYLGSCFIPQADPFPHIPHPVHNQTPFPTPTQPFCPSPTRPTSPAFTCVTRGSSSLSNPCGTNAAGAAWELVELFRPSSGKPLMLRLSVCD